MERLVHFFLPPLLPPLLYFHVCQLTTFFDKWSADAAGSKVNTIPFPLELVCLQGDIRPLLPQLITLVTNSIRAMSDENM